MLLRKKMLYISFMLVHAFCVLLFINQILKDLHIDYIYYKCGEFSPDIEVNKSKRLEIPEIQIEISKQQTFSTT